MQRVHYSTGARGRIVAPPVRCSVLLWQRRAGQRRKRGWSGQVRRASPRPAKPSMPWCGGGRPHYHEGRTCSGRRHRPQRDRCAFLPATPSVRRVRESTEHCTNGGFCNGARDISGFAFCAHRCQHIPGLVSFVCGLDCVRYCGALGYHVRLTSRFISSLRTWDRWVWPLATGGETRLQPVTTT